MNDVGGKTIMVTGASRGLGRAVAVELAERGASVVAVARNERLLGELAATSEHITTEVADVSDGAAVVGLVDRHPVDGLLLAAGSAPHIAPIQEQSWQQFSEIWQNDTRQAFEFGKAAVNKPLPPSSAVLIVSSGAAINGSPLSGGYAGAKRTQWFLAQYFAQASEKLGLGIRFQAILPNQIIPDTDLGNAASSGYAASLGLDQATFLQRFGAALSPQLFARHAADILAGVVHADATAVAVKGDGLTVLDGAA